jgi:hypothetical protein
MVESRVPKWYTKLGSTEDGEPLLDLIGDAESGRLERELADFPEYLLGQQRDGPERGTILQIAIKRGQAKAVAAITSRLLAEFEAAQSERRAAMSEESPSAFVHQLDGGEYPRLLNEDPLAVGPLSTILQALCPEQRMVVSQALLTGSPFFADSIERSYVGLLADAPELYEEAQAHWSATDRRLLSLEHNAERWIQLAKEESRGDWDEHHLLFEAARRNLPNAIVRLISTGESPNERDASGQTPLHKAATTNRLGCLRILLDHGADPFIEDNLGDIPLVTAIRSGSPACALYLAEKWMPESTPWPNRALVIAVQNRMFLVAAALMNLSTPESAAPSVGQENLLKDVLISDEACQWLFALLMQVLLSSTPGSVEVMPLLTIDDFLHAGHVVGLTTEFANDSMDSFLKVVASNIGMYDCLHSSVEVFGAPICLLFCAASLAVAITKDNTSFLQLHPQMRELFKSEYKDHHLGDAWNTMRQWLQSRELNLAWPEGSWRLNVGPPLYHAIWRPDDREDLFDALGAMGIDPARTIGVPEMCVLLDRAHGKFSAHIQTMLRSKIDRQAVVRSACANLSTLRIQRSSRSRSVVARTPWATLAWHRDIRFGAISITVTLPRREGMPESIFVSEMEVVSNGELYQAFALKADWLTDDNELKTDEGYTFRIPDLARPVVFDVHGDKLMATSMTVGESQLIVCRIDDRVEVSSFLNSTQNVEVKSSAIQDFPDHLVFGPITPTNEVEGPIAMTRRLELRAELIGGLRLRGWEYHQLALPFVRLVGSVCRQDLQWAVDGQAAAAELIEDDLGQYCLPPEGGRDYRLKVRGQEVARFSASPSVSEALPEGQRTRWPLLLPGKEDFVILGHCGHSAATVRLSRKTGLPTTAFEPVWALTTKAIPLMGSIPSPDHNPYAAGFSTIIGRVKRATAGDGLSQSRAQHFWKDYFDKAGE